MAQFNTYTDYEITTNGLVISKKRTNPKVLKPQRATQSKKGYYQVRLFSPETPKGKLHYIHRIIWETFAGEIPAGMEIDHKNSDTSNNSLENLQLITSTNNHKKYQLETFGMIIRDHRDELIKDYLDLGSFQKVADKWNINIISVYRVIKNKVATRENGKPAIKDCNNGIIDDFTKFDLRSDSVREKLGLPRITKKKKN